MVDPWDCAPVGLARIHDDGTLGEINEFGRELLAFTDPHVVLAQAFAQRANDGERESPVMFQVDGRTRVLGCRMSTTPDGAILAFWDVTKRQQRERRVAAIASAAASVVSERSLVLSLNAMSREIVRADGLAGVQILVAGRASDEGIVVDRATDKGLRIMGTAGFPASPRFFELLMECRARGAELRMLQAFQSQRPVVVHHRYERIMTDPAWLPLLPIMRHPPWDSFASVPLTANGRRIGVLNAFFTPGQQVDEDSLGFLQNMADQAALAIDYAELLAQQRHDAGRAERQRLARELHDSIIQQLFSLGMQTEAIKLLAHRPDERNWERVRCVAQELQSMTQSVVADLRHVVAQLHPASPTPEGLPTALTKLAETTQRRTGVTTTVRVPDSIDSLDSALAVDLYFIIAEAVHNAIKHAGGTTLTIEATHDPDAAWVRVVVIDDGGGFASLRQRGAGGYGLTSMHERAEHWGGTVTVHSDPTQGTRVAIFVPLTSTGLARTEPPH